MVLSILDLTNIPLVVGHVSVKWHLPSSSAAEHRGRTDKSRIIEHRANFDYNKTLPVRLTIDKNGYLQPCDIYFEILQEFDSVRGGKVHLGNVKLNLAEFTGDIGAERELEEGEEGMVTRRYLMQDSKVNATLKIGISMRQIDGDTNFIAPPLRSAMVIGGIAGIVSAEAGGDASDDMPSIASKSRELSEAQDMYRRTLAASWACERGELAPDKLIEDLFSGGDGGKMHIAPTSQMGRIGYMRQDRDSSNSSDADSRRGRGGSMSGNSLTPDMARHQGHRRGGNGTNGSQESVGSAVSGRGSIEQQMKHSTPGRGHHHKHSRHKNASGYQEVTEFDLRDDLRSWHVNVES